MKIGIRFSIACLIFCFQAQNLALLIGKMIDASGGKMGRTQPLAPSVSETVFRSLTEPLKAFQRTDPELVSPLAA